MAAAVTLHLALSGAFARFARRIVCRHFIYRRILGLQIHGKHENHHGDNARHKQQIFKSFHKITSFFIYGHHTPVNISCVSKHLAFAGTKNNDAGKEKKD
jgi:hypothetical protein